MRLALDFINDGMIGPRANIVLSHHVKTVGGDISLTYECASLAELDGQIGLIKRDLQKIRDEAVQKFATARK